MNRRAILRWPLCRRILWWTDFVPDLCDVVIGIGTGLQRQGHYALPRAPLILTAGVPTDARRDPPQPAPPPPYSSRHAREPFGTGFVHGQAPASELKLMSSLIAPSGASSRAHLDKADPAGRPVAMSRMTVTFRHSPAAQRARSSVSPVSYGRFQHITCDSS